MNNLIQETIAKISRADAQASAAVRRRWDSIAKPLRSLGAYEEILIRIAGAQHTPAVSLSVRTLVVFCADNGIVHAGVSQTGQEVTATVAENLASERATAAILCRETDTQILPVDVGMIKDVGIRSLKTAYGSENFACMDAMSRESASDMIEKGIRLAEELADAGNKVLMIGEMGIGNTSTSSAVCAVLLGLPVEEITGRGAGLSDEALLHKRAVLKQAVADRNPDPLDPIDVLAKVGGYDIAGMTGLILGAAARRIPVILDGFISAVGGLIAARLCPDAADYLIPSHQSSEPGANVALHALDLRAPIQADMRPGEGCGAVMLIPMLELILKIYHEMPTFEAIDIEAYELYDKA